MNLETLLAVTAMFSVMKLIQKTINDVSAMPGNCIGSTTNDDDNYIINPSGHEY